MTENYPYGQGTSNQPSSGSYEQQGYQVQQGYPSQQSHSAYDSTYGASAQTPEQPVQQTQFNYGSPVGNAGRSSYQGATASDGVRASNMGSTSQPSSYAQPAAASASGAKKGTSSAKTFLIAFAGALLACILAFGVMSFIGANGRNSVTLGSSETRLIDAEDADVTLAEAVSEKCLPSVVSINVFSSASSNQAGSIYDYLFGLQDNQGGSGELTQSGVGSGVVLSSDGYIITNNHVVSGGEAFKVVIEGETYDANLVGSDSSSDVAVLKVDGTSFTAIEIGDSDNITIGEWVMSIGSPFGLEQSVATGIVSATSRSQLMDSSTTYGSASETVIYPNLIQTDAAINPGNSGGALVDANGSLIGINTLITSYSGNYSGVGFAIPVNYAVNIAQDIIAGNEPTHAQLGVNMATVTAQTAKLYGFSADEGAYVSSVLPGSAAEAAGIQVGDIIVSFDGKQVTSSSDLMLDVRTKNPGDVVQIGINRDGQTFDVEVTLGRSSSSLSSSESSGNGSSDSGNQNGNGGNGYGYGQSDPYDSLRDLFGQGR